MHTVRIGLTAATILGLAGTAFAQAPVDVSRLPLDLHRIQQRLQQDRARDESEGLNLRFTIDVYAKAPPLVIFGPGDDLTNGPVPESAPTHRDMIDQVTPKEYRPPVADFGALARWLAKRSGK